MPSDDDIAIVDRTRLKWSTDSPEDLLGEGSFGRVYRGLSNGAPVAIKVVKRPLRDGASPSGDVSLQEQAAMKQHRREIHRFQVVQSPNIIQYLGVFRGLNPLDLYIVTEYLEGGSLHDGLTKMRAQNAALDTNSFLRAAYQIACGLNHVHVESYTHGDMKPQNILLTDAIHIQSAKDGAKDGAIASLPTSAKLKIADFGLSKRLEGAESPGLFGSTTATTDFGTGPCGTYLYMSPEAYDGVSHLTDDEAKAADVYAFGLVLFELLAGIQSWQIEKVRNPMILSNLVKSRKRPAWGERKPQIDPAYIALVEQCWSHDPNDRPTSLQIVDILGTQRQIYSQRQREQQQQIQSPPPLQFFAESAKISDCSNSTNVDENRPQNSSQPPAKQPEQVPTPPLLPAVNLILQNEQKQQPTNFYPSQPVQTSSNESAEQPSTNANNFSSNNPPAPVPPTLPIPPRPTLQLPLIGKSIEEDLARPCDNEEDLFTSEEYGSPTLKHVQSWKLTESEANEKRADILRRHPKPVLSVPSTDSEDEYSSGSEDDTVAYGMEPILEVGDYLVTGKDDPDERHEIDRTMVGGCKVRKVLSQRIPHPKIAPLALGDAQDMPGVMGTGSVAEPQQAPVQESSDPFSNTQLLDSFFREAEGHVESSAPTALPPGESPSPVTPPEKQMATPTGSANINSNSASINTSPQQQPVDQNGEQNGYAYGMEMKLPIQAPKTDGISFHPSKAKNEELFFPLTPEDASNITAPPAKRPHNYHSPSIDFDAETESELSQKDNMLLINVASGSPQNGVSKPAHTSPDAPLNGVQAPMQRLQQPGIPVHHQLAPMHQAHAPPQRVSPTEIQRPMAFAHVPPPHVMEPGLAAPGAESFTRYGASAPPMSATSSSVFGGQSTLSQGSKIASPSNAWHSSPQRYGQHGHMRLPAMTNLTPAVSTMGFYRGFVDENMVMQAVEQGKAVGLIREWWWNGYFRAVAGGLARARGVGGEEYLEMVTGFIAQQNGLEVERRDVVVMNGLCTTVGHIARGGLVGASSVTRAVPAVVGVLAAFQKLVEQHPTVYASACFALCNLFKVYNVIGDSLRANVASWIAYAIWRNVGDECHRLGSDVVGYTAMSAARNFMWMNEANVEAFISVKRGSGYGSGGIGTIFECMRFFEWRGQESVVEASLSGLAMIVHFPKYREEFVARKGVEVLLDIGKRHCANREVCGLVLSVLSVIYSGRESSEIFEQGMGKRELEGVVEILDCVQNGAENEVEVLESGYFGVLMLCRYSAALRNGLVEAGVLSVVGRGVELLRGVRDRNLVVKVGVLMCEVIKEVCEEEEGVRYMREIKVGIGLRELQSGDGWATEVLSKLNA